MRAGAAAGPQLPWIGGSSKPGSLSC